MSRSKSSWLNPWPWKKACALPSAKAAARWAPEPFRKFCKTDVPRRAATRAPADIRAWTRARPDGTALPQQANIRLAGDPEAAGQNERNKFMAREIVQLQCTTCKNKNHSTTKNRKTTTERLEFSKFCRKCRKH